MRQFTDDKEIEIVSSNLSQCQSLWTFLGSDWVEKELLQKKERSRVHFLFWLLFDKAKTAKLQSWLEILKNSLLETKFSGTLNKLRKCFGEIELYSLLSEIEVVSYYAEKGNVEYEPPQGDLKFRIDENEIHFEIAKLFSSKEIRRITDLSQLVWSKLDDLPENSYLLSFHTSSEFSEDDVVPFVEYVKNVISKKPNSFPSEKFRFGGNKASITLLAEYGEGKGRVGVNVLSFVGDSPAGRLKNKILNEASQLPEEGLNVVVYNIGLIGVDFDEAEEAFFGQVVCNVFINRQTRETTPKWVRLENGAIHEKEGKKISALIVYKDFGYENKKLFSNPLANYPLSSEIQSEI